MVYAHTRGVKVYVTVNTLIHDRELADVLEYLVRLYAVGVDAVLVQDTGVAALAHEIVPDLVSMLRPSSPFTMQRESGGRKASGSHE